MRLREHPLMSAGGIANWPPEWTWMSGRYNTAQRVKLEYSKMLACLRSTAPQCFSPCRMLEVFTSRDFISTMQTFASEYATC